ncbi:MAG: FG-GAP-like repeat-containing protein [Caldilineaceae bacterium]
MADYADNGTLGDIDGDGDLDLIVATTSGKALFGSTKVAFSKAHLVHLWQSGQALGEDNIYGAAGTVLGDLDGDHDLDAVVGSGDRGNQIWFNEGGNQGGTLGMFANSGQNLGVSRWPTALGDVDGDDDLDVIVVETVEQSLAQSRWYTEGRRRDFCR